ncbi:hypothetical protein [Clostridium sp. 29_15]|nr:hypothetical protein [Clostridium sp. 29_15]
MIVILWLAIKLTLVAIDLGFFSDEYIIIAIILVQHQYRKKKI